MSPRLPPFDAEHVNVAKDGGLGVRVQVEVDTAAALVDEPDVDVDTAAALVDEPDVVVVVVVVVSELGACTRLAAKFVYNETVPAVGFAAVLV